MRRQTGVACLCCLVGGVVAWLTCAVMGLLPSGSGPDMSYAVRPPEDEAATNLWVLQQFVEGTGWTFQGAAGRVVHVNAPAGSEAFDAHALARTIQAKVGGEVRVRDGAGRIAAICDDRGVRDGW